MNNILQNNNNNDSQDTIYEASYTWLNKNITEMLIQPYPESNFSRLYPEERVYMRSWTGERCNTVAECPHSLSHLRLGKPSGHNQE
jgi:hypothetical protein